MPGCSIPRGMEAVPISERKQNIDEQISYAEKVNAYLTDYIKFGDAKAGALLTLIGLLGTVIGVTADNVLPRAANEPRWLAAILIAGACLVLGTVLTAWFSLNALSPSTPKANWSLNSFPDIALLASSAYVSKLRELDARTILEGYANHNVALAQIAAKKFRAIQRAVFWLRFALFGSFAYAILYALLKVGSRQ